MTICHISDTHGLHDKIVVPECDVVIHTGDIGGYTNTYDLINFLIWFEKLPARKKIFIGGNHDIILDKNHSHKSNIDFLQRMILGQHHKEALSIIENYDVKYLCDKDYVFEGVKFYGSPYSPSFHRDFWVFNADRGNEINKIWSKIPSDVNILLTHTPPYNILDDVREQKKENELNSHVGCKDLLNVIKKRLHSLSLHAFGHIHENTGVQRLYISNKRHCLFSNGAVVNDRNEIIHPSPFLLTI